MQFARRMEQFGEGIFTKLLDIKRSRLEQGAPVIDLSVGTPNIPPATVKTTTLNSKDFANLFTIKVSGKNETK